MYQIIVPYRLEADDRRGFCSQKFINVLKRLSADQVAVYMEDWQNVQKNAPYLKQAVSYFSEHGFGLSLWINGLCTTDFRATARAWSTLTVSSENYPAR